jgi:hypothetical protein
MIDVGITTLAEALYIGTLQAILPQPSGFHQAIKWQAAVLNGKRLPPHARRASIAPRA